MILLRHQAENNINIFKHFVQFLYIFLFKAFCLHLFYVIFFFLNIFLATQPNHPPQGKRQPPQGKRYPRVRHIPSPGVRDTFPSRVRDTAPSLGKRYPHPRLREPPPWGSNLPRRGQRTPSTRVLKRICMQTQRLQGPTLTGSTSKETYFCGDFGGLVSGILKENHFQWTYFQGDEWISIDNNCLK